MTAVEANKFQRRQTSRIESTERRAGDIIGWSKENSPLVLTWLGDSSAAVRVFVIAGQHGDEVQGRQAAARLIASYGQGVRGVQAAVLTNANPDGALRNTRMNTDGIDLNRDHQSLRSVEMQFIHRFVRQWRPHVIVDVHNYPSRRRHLVERGLVAHHDVLVDVPTHPAIKLALSEEQRDEFLTTIREELKSEGYESERYVLVSPAGRVRHSTTDVVDARNGLALRYGALTVLLEGRAPIRKEGAVAAERTIVAQHLALNSILKLAGQFGETLIGNSGSIGRESEIVPVRCCYRLAENALALKFRDVKTSDVREVVFPEFRGRLKVTRQIALPAAYAVPLANRELIELLKLHGFAHHIANSQEAVRIERYFIESVTAAPCDGQTPKRISLKTNQSLAPLDGYAIFPITQTGGRALAVFLEPQSNYGLHRYGELNLPLLADSFYPILRVLAG